MCVLQARNTATRTRRKCPPLPISHLVQECHPRAVQQQPQEGHALLLSATQHVAPVQLSIKATHLQ